MSFRSKILGRLTLATLLVGIALATWAFWLEPASFRIHEETLSITDWPTSCENRRIAVLADLHVGSPYKGLGSLERLVDAVNEAAPDLVLLPGDFVIQGVVGGRFVPPEDAAAVLARLKAPMGVFAVLGNHDWWLDPARVATALSHNNIPVLDDRSELVGTGNCRIRLVGISDFWEGPHDVAKALRDVTPGEFVLAFTHNPDIFPELPSQVTLTIAGHTHGGQVHLPLLGRPIVPSAYGERYAIGHVIENGRHLYVSSGVGTSILPVRFRVPPEATMLRLTRSSN